jgi:uncharacterized protein YjiS (DUF1127 family)
MNMSRYLDGESVAFLAGGRSSSRPTSFRTVVDIVRVWRKRRRDRRELLRYFATDHRAPNDLGIDRANAHEWGDRPFWRA